jgi:hypothetical protein
VVDEQQQAWIAIQRAVTETLIKRLLEIGDEVRNAEEADMLADHIADDLMLLHPRVPEHYRLRRERPRRAAPAAP